MSKLGEIIMHSERKREEIDTTKKTQIYSLYSNKDKKKPVKIGPHNQQKNLRNSMTKPNAIVKISTSLIKKNKYIEELETKIEHLTKEINQLQVQKLKLNNKLLDIHQHPSPTLGFDTGSNFPQISKIVEKWKYFAITDLSGNYAEFDENPDIIETIMEHVAVPEN